MEHFTNPMGFVIGVLFLLFFVWNVLMGEIETRVGALRFDEHPFAWALINSFFLTIGVLACTHSVKDIQWLQWFDSFEKSLCAQSYPVFWVTYFACAVFAYALEKFVVRANR